ncbi:AsmA family protein [Endobacterium cereale]|nr:AsmA-like C-terminal region-containing protein [Endobacterium cereale]MEB2843274.1 AsmA-like C-terminal region-containing protein [Endobacterium cereale]
MLFLGGLVVVALFTALFAPFFLDWSSFRTEFENQASRILGKKVTVHGNVDARILPFPSVTMHDVRIGRDTDGTPQVQAAEFSMDMELAPFMSGEARIFDMRIVRPKARIRVLPDGTLDWTRGSRVDIPARNVVLEDVHVTDAEIEFIDEQTGRTRRLTAFNADMAAASLAGPWRADGTANLDGYDARFNFSSGEPDTAGGTVPLRLRLWPDLQAIELQLDGALAIKEGRAGYEGGFNLVTLAEETDEEPVTPPPPGPRVRGRFELTNDRIRIPEYRLELGAADNPYVTTGEATLDTGENPEFLLTGDGQQIDVNRLTQDETGGKTSRNPAVSAQRRLNALIRMAAAIPIPQVPGKVSLSLPAIVLNDTTMRDIHLDLRPAGKGWAVDNVVVTLPGRTRVEAKGNLQLAGNAAFSGDVLLASNQPSGFADWLSGKVDPAIRRLSSAGFSAKVDLTTERQRFEGLELAIGNATLTGNIERQSLPEQTPSLTVDLAGNEIDIDAMRALGSLLSGDDAGRDVLDHKLSGTLRADRFNAFGVAADKVDTSFAFADGALSLERLTVGDIAGAEITANGRFEGSLLAYAGTGTVALKSSDPTAFLAMLRDRLPRNPALAKLADIAGWYAETDLKVDVTVGGNVNGLAASLSGVSNGSRVNGDIRLPELFDLTDNNSFVAKASLENPNASTLFGQAGLDPLPFDVDGDGRLTVAVSGGEDKPATVDLAYAAGETTFSAKGEINLIDPGFGNGKLALAATSPDIEPYLLMTGIGLPQFGAGLPAKLSTDLTLTPEAITVAALDGTLSGNALSGEIRLDRSTPALAASGRLAIDTLDLAWLGEAIYGPLTNAETGRLTSKDFSLPVFGGADVTLDVSAKTLRTDFAAAVTGFTGRITHRGGNLTIENLAGIWNGGKIGGRVMMSNGQGVGIFQTRLTLEGGNLAPLLWQAESGAPVATGGVGFDLVAEATAKSVADLLGSASGSGQVRLSNITVNGLNPGLLTPLLTQADGIKGEVTAAKVQPLVAALVHAGQTRIGDVAIPFTMTNGEARAQNIAAADGAAKLNGALRLNFSENTLAGEIAVGFDAGEEALAGGDAALKLVYSGDLSEPTETIDVSDMSNFLSMRAFEKERRRVETLQASVLEKQRLRREAALYTFRENERRIAREKAVADEKARLEEDARIAAEQEQRRQLEEKAADERRRREEAEPRLTLPPADGGSGTPALDFNTQDFRSLPGVQQ